MVKKYTRVLREILERKKQMELQAPELDQDDWESWANLCDELVAVCENELPDKAAEFAESVIEKLTSMAESIAQRETITENQRNAISNMERGISKWIK
jgi:hypothetical protein